MRILRGARTAVPLASVIQPRRNRLVLGSFLERTGLVAVAVAVVAVAVACFGVGNCVEGNLSRRTSTFEPFAAVRRNNRSCAPGSHHIAA